MNPNNFVISVVSVRRTLSSVLTVVLLSMGLTQAASVFERPVPEGGGPTEIRSSMAIFDIDEISDANQNFTVNLFARFQWNDLREAHGGQGDIVKNLGEVWHPHILFINMQKSWAQLDKVVQIAPNGDVVLRRQFWGDFSQPLNLHDFPFDRQELQVQVISGGAAKPGELVFVDDPEFKSMVAENYSVPDWKVLGHEVSSKPVVLPTGDKVVSYELKFSAKRLSNHFVIKVIAPLLMIVMVSWLAFWLAPTEGGSQLSVAITCFLTVIAYHIALGAKLPKIPYLTRLDVFVFGSTFLVFIALIEVVITTRLARGEQIKAARRMDRVCRFLFPSMLALIGLYAFLWH